MLSRVGRQKHTITSAEGTAGLAEIDVTVRNNIELTFVSAYAGTALWRAISIGIRDITDIGINVVQGYSTPRSNIKWNGSLKMYCNKIRVTVKNCVAAEEITIKYAYRVVPQEELTK